VSPVEVTPTEELDPEQRQQREEVISLVRVILERELGRSTASDSTRSALEKLLEAVRAKDFDSLKSSYEYQLSQVENPSEELDKAGKLLAKLFA
jgi:hypothetical protein